MRTITATELARNLREVLDRMIVDGESIEIERNHTRIARLVPGAARQNAMEAMSDLYRTLDRKEGQAWRDDSRYADELGADLRDPWRS